jgi:membrane fusion protein (multidrug efflux system)
MKTKTKLWIAVVVGLFVLVGALGGVKAAQIGTMIKSGEGFAMPPEAVTSAPVRADEWQPARTAIGSLVAVRGVTLSAELPGMVREIAFDSGTSVRRGALMVRFDTSTEEAQLAAAQAEASLASLNLQRARSLRQGEANTQADLDQAEARMKQAEAAVATLQATIAKKTVRAPFDGRVSIRQVELGQVVGPGTPIATLQSVDPILAEFSLPQQALAAVKLGQAVRMQTDAFVNAAWDGQVTTINSEVDPATRNVRMRATFPNPGGTLRPGMYVNVRVLGDVKQPVLLIPATAVLYAPYGDSVFLIEDGKAPDGKPTQVARQKFVRLGERRGDLVAVASGLEAGQTVVSSGAFKLRPGTAVVVQNDLAPDARLAPTPSEN